ncbi:hypothetical protein [Pseudobacteroides cellulosolvens]|uniref:Uncharacterized protein n=1 Tax=Pseudobacteroides cellulosolvens ATCC 35603 = DSM 2933 TaxID=398512 RepID=A0A0L6JNN0_9FIRM|nr:hypothetical protein [Pseudobacteroides cellulosolvens]KNY27364.1 hypothetical protein Bccel_2635 [Pseudobacteroides cellulosolvens ATCC 35603 = DSM 2933]
MVISLKRFRIPIIGLLIIAIVFVSIWMVLENKKVQTVMGGFVHKDDRNQEEVQTAFNVYDKDDISERFQRPSKQPAFRLKYAAKDFINKSEQTPQIQTVFQTQEDVIQAYYAILKDASNMAGYYGRN